MIQKYKLNLVNVPRRINVPMESALNNQYFHAHLVQFVNVKNQLACNVTNGMCYKEPTKHDSVDGNGKNNEFYNNSSDLLFFLLLSSFVSALCMTGVIFLFMQCKKNEDRARRKVPHDVPQGK